MHRLGEGFGMSEGRAAGWRAWTAAAVFLALMIGGLILTRKDDQPPPPPAAPAPAEPVVTRPSVPEPPPPLGRADLIEAANLAASRYAAREPASVALLAGRRFVLNLPFGCEGPAEDLAELRSGWTYDPESRTLRAKVEPQVWTEAPFVQAIAQGATFEAAEGFWIERPWTGAETCPPNAGIPVEAPPSRETLALVELFEPDAKRAERRSGRAYQAVQTVHPGDVPLDQGLRLRVEGRLAAFGDGPPIGCWSETPNLRPICAVRVRFDRVAITDATGSRIFAEWKN